MHDSTIKCIALDSYEVPSWRTVPYADRQLGGGGGGGNYLYICVLPDYFLLKSIVFKVYEHEYMNNCPPITDLSTALIEAVAI